MSESEIPHGDELTVSVNGAAYVQLHHPDGRTTLCPAGDVGLWDDEGWSTEEQPRSATPPPVQLYHPDGRTARVPEADVERWLGEGWSREEHDVEEASTQLLLLLESAKGAVATYVADVRAAGTIDTAANAAMAVAETAMEEVVVAWSRLHRFIHARYAVRQGDEPPPTAPAETAPEGGA